MTPIEALAETLLPAGGSLPGARDVDLAGQFEAYVARMEARPRRTLRLMVAAFALSSVATRWARPFHLLAPDQRARYLEVCETSRIRQRREALVGLKALLLMLFCSDPRVAPLIGYDGRPFKPVAADPGYVDLPVEQLSGYATDSVDVVIVGSGAGGSVAARELARAGLSVLVLEEGAYFNRRDFTGPLPDRLQRLYRDAGMTFTIGTPVISLPMGRGVGGSTLINSGTCFRTPDSVLHEWRSALGLALDLDGSFAEVERSLNVGPVTADIMGRNGQVLDRGRAALGLSGGPIARNARGCHGSGVCAFGCPLDAKLGMHVSYLPEAVAAGARILTGARADRIILEGGRAVGVRGRGFEVRAKAVVLAAGAIHTPDLLLRNGIANSSRQVGRNLRIHPGLGVLGVFDHDIAGWQGVMQSYQVDERLEDGILLEATYPPPGVGYSAGGVGHVGVALKDALARYKQTAACGLIVSDTGSGTVRAGPGGPLMLYSVDRADTRKLLEGMALATELYLAAGAESVETLLPGLPPVRSRSELKWITEGRWTAAHLKLSAYHPMGTARMGADRAGSVVDEFGQSWDVPGLRICDASILPGSTHVNPQVTIMALATRVARRLADQLT